MTTVDASSVSVILNYTHKYATMTVTDTGVGIPSANLKHLNLGPHDASDDDGSTSAISLTFAKKLVHLHHGDFEVESATAWESIAGDHGTTFRVRIPMGTNHLPPENIGDSDATRAVPDSRTMAVDFGREMIDEVGLWHMDRISDDTTSAPTSVSSHETFGSKLSRGIDPTTLYFAPEDVIMVVDGECHKSVCH